MATVQDIKQQVTARLRDLELELAALEQERAALTKVLETLGGPAAPSGASNGRRRAAGATGARAARRAPRRASGPRRTARSRGGRAEQTVKIIARKPGATVRQIADELGIKPNYLYRVLPALEAEGRIAKQGKGYVAA